MERFDVVVVGAGPAGSSAALFAASGGARTLLLDRREEIGYPVQCGEFLPTLKELESIFPSHEGFREVYDIPEETILERTHLLECVAPGGRRYSFPMEGFSVSRRALDKIFAYRAEKAGVELRHPVTVVRLEGNIVHLAKGDPVEATVIVAADGPLSVVGRSLGITMVKELYRMITTNATTTGAFDSTVELYFGRVAPGGYAWVIPKGDEANVGLGASHLPRGETLSSLLSRFARKRELSLKEPYTRWWVPIGEPPETAVHGNVLFTGDAANMVMATNGGGIPTAMITGMYAGKAAARHVRDKIPVAEYDSLWRRNLYAPLHQGYALKRHLGDRVVNHDWLLSLGMRYLGEKGMDAFIRMKRPRRLWGPLS